MIKIAVVDDEAEVFQLFKIKFKNQIRSNEYCFHFFENGKDCYSYIDNAHLSDDVEIIIVFTDINMPEMSGISLLETLKSNHPDIDVYLISAYDYDPYREKAKKSGTNGFISKPFDFEEIDRFIKKSIEDHRGKVSSDDS
ncbi:MAG: response regulator [Bacteriovoracaceae bacterium]|nr:response regulator [Bacteriovoracaceae bacterium]